MNSSAFPLNFTYDVWELPWPKPFVPDYRETTMGEWTLKKIDLVPQRGYFQDWSGISPQYILLASGQTWMATAVLEVESQAPHIAAARGHVVVMGSGLGLALYNILPQPQVTRVTLVERDPLVLDLLRQAVNLDEWPGVEKLEIEIIDAFDYRPSRPVNYLYVDIWAKTGDPQALPDTQQIQQHVNADLVGWWSQEIHFLRWLKHKGYGYSPSIEQYREWAREISLPLIEQDNLAYVACIPQVARSYCHQTILQEQG